MILNDQSKNHGLAGAVVLREFGAQELANLASHFVSELAKERAWSFTITISSSDAAAKTEKFSGEHDNPVSISATSFENFNRVVAVMMGGSTDSGNLSVSCFLPHGQHPGFWRAASDDPNKATILANTIKGAIRRLSKPQGGTIVMRGVLRYKWVVYLLCAAAIGRPISVGFSKFVANQESWASCSDIVATVLNQSALSVSSSLSYVVLLVIAGGIPALPIAFSWVPWLYPNIELKIGASSDLHRELRQGLAWIFGLAIGGGVAWALATLFGV